MIFSLKKLSATFARQIQNNFGLAFLIIVITLITLANFNFKFGIFGWDNFSVELDLKTNFFRTLFSTWRDYRGFGVPSDSEVADIFRQIPLLFLSKIFPVHIVNQLYFFSCLWIGSISSFLLVKEIIKKTFFKPSACTLQLGSLIGSIYYTFNFHNIDVFYLPLIMYVSRFAFFPLLTYLVFKILSDKKIEPKLLIGFVFASLFAAPTYLTATTFFTLIIIFGTMFFSFATNIKKYLLLGLAFLLLNAFWLFPFANYSLNKTQTITKSSTFALVNEFLLNQFAERFSFDKLITLSSDFSSGLPFTNISKNEPIKVHPQLNYTKINEGVAWYLYTPLPIILMGLVFTIWNLRHSKFKLIWVLILTLISVFFLRKEYPPVGYVFDWLGTTIPPLKVVLRFGTTKINILLVTAFSIFAGIGMSAIAEQLQRKMNGKSLLYLMFPLTFATILSVGWIAIFPLTGKLTFSLLKTSIPNQYRQIAQTINNDQDYFRVLHVPFGQYSYWRSYSWGYYGSAFFNFLLDKPLLDKTFSPGSPENDFFDHALNETTQNLTLLEESDAQQKIQEFYRLLQISGVKYIVLDESVEARLVTRDIKTWEYIPMPQTKLAINELEKHDYIELIQEEDFDLKKLTLERGLDFSEIVKNSDVDTNPKIKLYKVKNYQPIARTPDAVTNIDSTSNLGFISPTLKSETDFIYQANSNKVSYLFIDPLKKINYQTKNIEITKEGFDNGKYEISTNFHQDEIATSSAYNIYYELAENDLVISAKKTKLPFTADGEQTTILATIPAKLLDFESSPENQPFSIFLNNWHVLGEKNTSNYRIQIADIILPIPNNIPTKKEYLATILLDNSETTLSLLEKEVANNSPISPKLFKFTKNPNCYDDKSEGYKSNIDYANNRLNVESYHGTTCLGVKIDFEDNSKKNNSYQQESRYFELGVEATQNETGNENLGSEFSPSKLQQAIRSTVNALPSYSSYGICLKTQEDGLCLNRRTSIVSGEEAKKVIVSSEQMASEKQLYAFIILPTINNETQKLSINSVDLRVFKPVFTTEFMPPYEKPTTTGIEVTNNNLSLKIPYVLSRSAYFMNKGVDAFQPKQRGFCIQTVGDHRDQRLRLIKKGQNQDVISYLDDCYQSFFVYLPLKKQAAYLWSVDYHLFTGGQPQFIAVEPIPLKNEYVSFFAGYPNIPGFKNLQFADRPFVSKLQYERIVANEISNSTNRQDHVLVNSYSYAGEERDEFFEFHQTVANQALTSLGRIDVFAIPEEWQNLAIVPSDNSHQLNFDQANIVSVDKIIPSLWKIKLKKPENGQSGKILLQFGQAFDSQWQLFNTEKPFEALFNKQLLNAEQVRVNSWSNGWIIGNEIFVDRNEITLIALYIPERLALLGWITTLTTLLITLAIALVMWLKKKINNKNSHQLNISQSQKLNQKLANVFLDKNNEI